MSSADVLTDGVELAFTDTVHAADWNPAWVEVSNDGVTWHHGTTVTQSTTNILHFTGFGFDPDNTYTWRFNTAPSTVIAPESGDFP